MAPQPAKPPAPAHDEQPIGPPSGLSATPVRFLSEQTIQQMLKSTGYDQAREDTYRIKGIQLIDNVREALQLPVRVFNTAAVYYHKFRFRYPSSEYDFADVALASLFVACKTEDTSKKSRDILCAAHNLKHPNDQKTPDDKAFDSPSGVTVGLERHVLETICFDFRSQNPHKFLIKAIREMFPPGDSNTDTRGKTFLRTAYDMSIDLNKTFAPLKQYSSALVLAVLELTALILGQDHDKVKKLDTASFSVDWGCVYETMMDLLDLYTGFPKSTKIGSRFDLEKLMGVKSDIKKKMSKENYERYVGWCDQCAREPPDVHPVAPGSAKSPATNSSMRQRGGNEPTVRYVFHADEGRKEKALVSEYFVDEWEEYEVEVEEPIPEPEPRHPSNGRGSYPHRGRSHHNDHGWTPYNRGRHTSYSDRSRGRKHY
ncbi:C-terminal domain kinase-like protein [Cercophora newfieldiana]|uniref:RNA polymerase II holoenzyme cyclin-like subunit n=1 Tax=Cercophora newfieldiana TaxID=92897 RepID=A0AA39XZC8_9PEZI|nr:C-terminal domain kinase-like protein [Cercophora newfieldiana]